jgi:hypothetical protein
MWLDAKPRGGSSQLATSQGFVWRGQRFCRTANAGKQLPLGEKFRKFKRGHLLLCALMRVVKKGARQITFASVDAKPLNWIFHIANLHTDQQLAFHIIYLGSGTSHPVSVRPIPI